MNIPAQTVTTTQTLTSSFNISTLNAVHVTHDDPINGVLRIQLSEANPPQMVSVTGADYSSLGQWTDSILTGYIVSRFGLTGV